MSQPLAKLDSLITPKRQWFQFRLRTLFVLTTIVSVPYGWHAFQIAEYQWEHRTLIAINNFGGTCFGNFPPDDQWYIFKINLAGTRLSDADLPRMLDPLDPHNKVATLDLAGTGITDAGLTHLRRFVELRSVNLTETNVTAAGVAELQKALPNCKIVR